MLHRMWCCAVGQALLLCPVCLFVDGALWRSTRKHSCLPTLRGGSSAVATPATWTDLLGARAERVPDCSSYLSRIPGSATDSGSSIHPRDSRGSRGGRPRFSPQRRASPRLIKRQRCWRVDPPLADLKACPIKRRRCQRVDHRW